MNWWVHMNSQMSLLLIHRCEYFYIKGHMENKKKPKTTITQRCWSTCEPLETLSLSKQNCANQGNKMTEGNTPLPIIIWTRGFCPLPSSLYPHWMMVSLLSSLPLVWRKMVFVLLSKNVPVAWATRDTGWIRAWAASRVRPSAQQEHRQLPQHCGSVAGWMPAFWLSSHPPVWLLSSPNLKSLPILTNIDEIAMGTKDSLKLCPVACLTSFFLCQMSYWLCKKKNY